MITILLIHFAYIGLNTHKKVMDLLLIDRVKEIKMKRLEYINGFLLKKLLHFILSPLGPPFSGICKTRICCCLTCSSCILKNTLTSEFTACLFLCIPKQIAQSTCLGNITLLHDHCSHNSLLLANYPHSHRLPSIWENFSFQDKFWEIVYGLNRCRDQCK